MTDTKQKSPKKNAFVFGVILLALGLAVVVGTWKINHPKPDEANAPVSAAATLEKAAEATSQQSASEAAAEKSKPAPVMEANGRFLGKNDAPIKVIEFASLTCSHCAHFHNTILDELRVRYVDTGLVQFEFRDFPLNKPAFDASRIVSCLPDQQQFSFMSLLFQTQNHWAFSADYLSALRQNAKLAGMSDEKFDSCLNDKALEDKMLAQIKSDAEKYNIQSTPSFVLNDGAGKISGAVPASEFGKQLDALLPPGKRLQDEKPAEPAATPTPAGK